MNDWRKGSYVYQIYKSKKISFKIILKRNIISYFDILDNIEYLEMKYYLLEHSYKYRYFLIKEEEHKVLIGIESINPESECLKIDSEYDSDTYTDDSGSNNSDYSYTDNDNLEEFTQ